MQNELLETMGEGLKLASAKFDMHRMEALGQELTFQKPIKVDVSRDVECYVAASRRFSVHGTGNMVGDALLNYMEEFIRYFNWLGENEADLTPPLRKELENIRKLITEAS